MVQQVQIILYRFTSFKFIKNETAVIAAHAIYIERIHLLVQILAYGTCAHNEPAGLVTYRNPFGLVVTVLVGSCHYGIACRVGFHIHLDIGIS